MSESEEKVNVSAQDILAAIGFEAQRIVAAVSQHAAGYPFPKPDAMSQILQRMTNLNNVLIQIGDAAIAGDQSVKAKSGVKAELN